MELLDPFGRKHDYLRISLTDRCNLRCSYCMPENGIKLMRKEQLMSLEEIAAIAEIFVSLGVKKIRLTGGEPLVRKGFEQLLQALSSLPVQLYLSSNAVLIDTYIDALKHAKVQGINISIDSLKPQKFNLISRRNYFDKVFNNIDLLLKNNFHIKLNVVAIKGFNDDEIIDFIEFVKAKKTEVRFIEFMPFKDNQWKREEVLSFDEMMQQIQAFYGADNIIKLTDEANATALAFQVKGHAGKFAFINTVTKPFCSTCNRIRLTSDGKMKNCLFSNNETDLLSRFRQGEDIVPFIKAAIWSKKAVRAGMLSEDELQDVELNQKNRSMIAIGG